MSICCHGEGSPLAGGSQTPVVTLQVKPAAQVGVPAHAPAEQASLVQATPSLHGVPSAAKPFAGHAADAPVQVSATSQAPAAGRQTAPAPANWQPAVQQAPPSQASPASTTPLPHCAVALTVIATVRDATPPS